MRRWRGSALRWALLAVAAAVALFPFYWMLRTSVAPSNEQFLLGVSFFPSEISFDNYADAWRIGGFGRAMTVGTLVAGLILVVQLVTVVPAAFALSALPFRGRDQLFLGVLTTLLVPHALLAIPTFVLVNELGLTDSSIGLVLPFVTSGFGIFLVRQHMASVPPALVDAARADGLSTLQLLWRVYVPLARPAIAAFSVFSFYVHWNDYIWPLLVVRDESLRTPPLALAVLQGTSLPLPSFGLLTAGAVIVTAPVVVLFLAAQRQFVRGIAGGEVVG